MTVLTERRVRHFCDKNVVEECQAQILRACEKHKFSVSASCYMPDHWHALVRGISGECAFLPFMKLGKQLSGYHVKRLLHMKLWSDGYYDRVVREDEDIMRYVRYIWMNPVVARLVSRPGDYPYTYIAAEFRQLLDVSRDTPDEARPDRRRATRPRDARPKGRANWSQANVQARRDRALVAGERPGPPGSRQRLA